MLSLRHVVFRSTVVLLTFVSKVRKGGSAITIGLESERVSVVMSVYELVILIVSVLDRSILETLSGVILEVLPVKAAMLDVLVAVEEFLWSVVFHKVSIAMGVHEVAS